MERFYFCVSRKCTGLCRRGGGAVAAVCALPAHAADRAALPRRAGVQYLRRHLCGAVFAVYDQPRYEFAGAAGHRRDAAVLLGGRVKRRHDVPLRRHCAQRRDEHPPQQTGRRTDTIKIAGAAVARLPLLLTLRFWGRV